MSCQKNQPQALHTELWSSEEGGQWPEMAPWELTWGVFSSLRWAYESGVRGPKVSEQAPLLRMGLPSQPCMHAASEEAVPRQGAHRAGGSTSLTIVVTIIIIPAVTLFRPPTEFQAPSPLFTHNTNQRRCQSCLKRKVRLRGGVLCVPRHRLPGVKLVSQPRLPGCIISDGPHLEIISF